MTGPTPRPLPLDAFTQLVDGPTDDDAWRPVPVDAPGAEGPAALRAVCEARGVRILDTLAGQLAELARVRHPAADDEAARHAFVTDAVGPGSDAYGGTWMYFPWTRTVVRLLDAEDYFDVVTDRNQDKITRAEQRLLRTRSIGVVGLSVGGEIAFTLAQEHLCGRMVLADFDTLDLSNLNRLSAGVVDLGVNKARLLARRIALLDPYLTVDIVPEGVNEGNADRVLDGLDLLVEECDDLSMKLALRQHARTRGIDVLFAADEGGFLSVEPYGQQDLAPFHGRVTDPPRRREDYPDAASFWRALTAWLGGWDVISDRSRASVERIGLTLCGYPQLAGEPRQAAAQVAHVARRMLLGEPFPGMVVRHDLETLLAERWGELQ